MTISMPVWLIPPPKSFGHQGTRHDDGPAGVPEGTAGAEALHTNDTHAVGTLGAPRHRRLPTLGPYMVRRRP